MEEVLFVVPVVETVRAEAETPALALNSFENAPVAPEKLPLNVTSPAAERPALNELSAVNVFAPPAVIPVTAPVMPLNDTT